MHLKTYRARTIADALAQVKKDLGRDAVILHTRSYKAGGWLGFGGRPMIEITASSGLPGAPRPKRPRAPDPAPARDAEPSPAAAAAALRRAYESSARDAFVRTAPAPAPSPVPAPTAAVPTPVPGPAPGHAPGPAPALVTTAAFAPAGPAATAQIEQELASIKAMVARAISAGGGPRRGPALTPEALMSRYLRMLENEVSEEIAEEVVAGVREDLSAAQLSDEHAVHHAVLRRLAAYVPVAGDEGEPERMADGRPLTIALVGPTGVGKTTTLAKLAATYKLRDGKKVGLITADTYRIAAVEQLRTYANIIGLPLRVAQTPSEMAAACESLAECDVVLIDTAGRSPHDEARLDELRAFLDASRPHQTHLVLSGTSSESCLVAVARRFAVANPDRVIFTKLDEAASFGALVNVARRVNVRLSFVTTGQEVPDRIEVGRADRLARLALEGREAP